MLPLTQGLACPRSQKLALSKVLGISAMTALELHDGSYKEGAFGPIRSVEELRAHPAVVKTLSIPWVRKQEGEDGEKISIAIQHSLRYHEELMAPVAPADAERMLAAVRGAARLAHSQRVGAGTANCPPPRQGETPCRCCWHAEFVGGARTKGRAGHDVDILVWHHSEASCVNGGQRGSDYLLYPLVQALEARADAEGRLLREAEGYQRIERRSDWVRRKAQDGVHKHHRQPWMTWKTHNGIENLSLCDYHDKLFGIWRTPSGVHHRIDVVVVAFADELPFARLAWTGSRTFNRLCRLRAIHLGLNLGPHNITAREKVTVMIDAHADSPLQIELPPLGVVPFDYCRTEADILRLLARGTDDFAALYDPLHRNA